MKSNEVRLFRGCRFGRLCNPERNPYIVPWITVQPDRYFAGHLDSAGDSTPEIGLDYLEIIFSRARVLRPHYPFHPVAWVDVEDESMSCKAERRRCRKTFPPKKPNSSAQRRTYQTLAVRTVQSHSYTLKTVKNCLLRVHLVASSLPMSWRWPTKGDSLPSFSWQ